MAFLNNFLFINPFLGHVNGHSHGSHNAPVQIIQRRFVNSKIFLSFSCFDRFLGNTGFLQTHHFFFRLNTGRIIFLHIPYICMALTFNLLSCLIHCLTETFVYFFVNALFVLIPDQAWNIVNGSFQKMAGLPEIFLSLILLLPSLKTKPKFYV